MDTFPRDRTGAHLDAIIEPFLFPSYATSFALPFAAGWPLWLVAWVCILTSQCVVTQLPFGTTYPSTMAYRWSIDGGTTRRSCRVKCEPPASLGLEKCAKTDPYPFYCYVGRERKFYECNIEGKDTRFADSYKCYGPSDGGGEWEDFFEVKNFKPKYADVPLPDYNVPRKRKWRDEKDEKENTKRRPSKQKLWGSLLVKEEKVVEQHHEQGKKEKGGTKHRCPGKKDLLAQYTKYLYRRMFVWCVQHPQEAFKNIIFKDGTVPTSLNEFKKIFSVENIPRDPLLTGAKSGNAYRHLDSGTRILGADIRTRLNVCEGGKTLLLSKNQVGEALCICLFEMAGFKQHVVKDGFKKLRVGQSAKGDTAKDLLEINKRWERLPLKVCLPGTVAEIKIFKLFLQQKNRSKAGEKLFVANFQTQGYRWISYLHSFMQQRNIDAVVEGVCNSKTWVGAIDIVTAMFDGIGPYTAAQALCNLFFGVYQGKKGLFRHHDEVVASMVQATRHGPGPLHSLRKIYGKTATFSSSIVQICDDVEKKLEDLRLQFPYLKAADRTKPRLMTCIDHEHSLCYFHRYLTSMSTLGVEGAELVHERFQADEFKKYVKLRGLKFWEGKHRSTVGAFLDRLLLESKNNAMEKSQRLK